MLLKKGLYYDNQSKISYNLTKNISNSTRKVFLIQGENGIGKTRFVEGVLLKNLKKNSFKTLYFSQDIENQIISFELISVISEFVSQLRKSGSFFKTILFNDDSHEKIDLHFDNKKILEPDNDSINSFIKRQAQLYGNSDVVIMDEVDKYFKSKDEFYDFINNISVDNVFIISHLIEKGSDKLENFEVISLGSGENDKEVVIE